MPNTMISSGVISEPPPMPVAPTRTPTPSPNRMMAGSTRTAETRPSRGGGLHVQPALRLLGARPAAVATGPGLGAVRAADGLVPLVVQRVVGKVVLGDVAPHVLVGPVGQRRGLPLLVLDVPAELRSVRPQRRLVAAQAGDPRVDALEGARQRLDLAHAAAGVRVAGPQAVDPLAAEDLDLRAVALLDPPPGLVGLREQHAGIQREDPGRRLDPQDHIHDHRRLLLEGAGDRQPRMVLTHDMLEDLGRSARLQVGDWRGGSHRLHYSLDHETL